MSGSQQPAAPARSPNPGYSRAFESFVVPEPEKEDVVGLLAYALYKQAVREARLNGLPAPPSIHRTPTQTEREAYRGAAERLLQQFSKASIDAAMPDILQGGFDAAVEVAESELRDLIKDRTSMRTAIMSNLAAWALTLAITILVVNFFYLPNWQADLIERLRMTSPAIQQGQPAAP